MSNTIVLIHGAWLTPLAWERFKVRYEGHGYTVLAPPWPLEDRPISDLRRAPDPELGKLSITRIVDHYDAIVRALPKPPLLIGHSFGGLFVQLLLDRGLGAAGVALSPAAPKGVLPGLVTLKSALPVFTAWNGWNRVLSMTFDTFASRFANGLPEPERRPAYQRHIVPTPGRIYYQGAFGVGTGIRWDNPDRASLLLVAGEIDRTIQPSMVASNYDKQRKSPSMTGLKQFSGRSHFMFAEPGWEEVADYALEWARDHAR